MRLAVISFTQRGSRLNAAVSQALQLKGYDCDSYCMEKYAAEYDLKPLQEPLGEWTGRMFAAMDGILFIAATGIAVRSIAPYVKDKMKDPAIVVMDEKGLFAISLMSGHLGGANELAGTLANLTGAIPVITTATDVNGRFAVDVFAKKNNLMISDRKIAKAVSADVLDEKQVGLQSDFPIMGVVPQELVMWDPQEVFEGENGICISLDDHKNTYRHTLHLIPRIVTVGIGCRKQTPMERIEEKVLAVLQHCRISTGAVEQIASIDLKAKEAGLLSLADKYQWKYMTYSTEELLAVEGEFSESTFVQSVTGVSNVCERSAVLASGYGRLIQKKTASDGVTVAIAVKKWSVDFE